MNLTLMVIAVIIIVTSITFFIYYQKKRKSGTKNSSKEKIDQHIIKNQKHINIARDEMRQYKDKLLHDYIETLSTPLLKLIHNFKKFVDAAIDEKTRNVLAIVKLCNHKGFVLGVKKQLEVVSEKIQDDFFTINQFFPDPFPHNLSHENKQEILKNIIPIVSIFDEKLKEISKIESKLVKYAKEYKKLKKPGIFKKIEHFLDSDAEKKDKRKKKRIEKDWQEYKKCWEELQTVITAESDNKIHQILDVYLTKLIVFIPVEQLNFQMVVKKKDVGNFLTQIRKGVQAA